jgi:hypothetical protein
MMPPRIRQGRFAYSTSRAARLLPVDRFASHDRKQGTAPTRRISRTHQEEAIRMTAPIRSTSSGLVAPHRSEPATARTFIWLTRQAVSGTDSLRLDCRMFHMTKGPGNLIIKAPLIRSEQRGICTWHTHLVYPGECRKGSSVAAGPVAALDTSAIFYHASSRQRGRRRHGIADRTRAT